MSYILGREETGTGCIFDRNPGKKHDRNNLILFRDELSVILLNRFPYANGHLLIAPSRHVGDILDLYPEESVALFSRVQQSVAILKNNLRPAGFNIGLNIGKIAGAGIAEHLHFHVVPRWEDDHNFMTVINEIRTIPEHINTTFDNLLADFQELQEQK
jgi:ATP adenylyltransferase